MRRLNVFGGEVCYKLDALCSLNFVPKQVSSLPFDF